MKILFIGGTGLISTAVSKLVLKSDDELFILNRGNNNSVLPLGATYLIGDINNEESIKELIKDYYFDTVVQWIAFTKEQVERDYRIFSGKTKQYIFISSASAYIKPIPKYPITEDVPLGNKYWQYSDNKRLCEEYLISVHSEDFNVTIIRPSHTYNDEKVVAVIKSWGAPYTIIDRLLKGKKTIIPGDGTSLWTLTYNADFADAFVKVLGNPKTYGEVYHLTSDFVYTWERINELLCENLGVIPKVIHIPSDFIIKHAPFLEGELLGDKHWSAIFDNSKIKEIAPKAIKRILENKDLQTIDEDFNKWYDNIISEYEKLIK
jgi:nucleoside-diphosphate-sugar epimerase